MNTIFLTSQAHVVLEKVSSLLPKKPTDYKVVFIPTASNPYTSAPWLDGDRAKLTELGFQVTDLDIDTASKEEIQIALDSTDIIFVAGGNTFYLLEKAKKSGFLELTKKAVSDGKIYIGSSAGSVLAAPNIKYVELLDDAGAINLENTKALGIVDFAVLPHFGNEKYKELCEQVLKEYQSDDYKVLPVRDIEFALKDGNILSVSYKDSAPQGSFVHHMKLQSSPFEQIKNETKTIEIRLNDEKRKLLNIGDEIEFSLMSDPNQKILTKVVDLKAFPTFKDLCETYPPEKYGSETQDEWQLMYQYYSHEDEKKYGVLAIHLDLI